MIDSERLFEIRKLIVNHRIVNQQQLQLMMKDRGYDLTLSTISRDLEAIHARKIEDENGSKMYILQQTDRYMRIPHSTAMRLEEKHWFVMLVRMYHEKRVAEELTNRSIENWIPAQIVRRRWSDRIKVMQHLVITKVVFVHCTETQRVKDAIVKGATMSYLMDKSLHLPATIPVPQLETFQLMVANSSDPVEFTEELLHPGEKVQITKGPLFGHVAEICKFKGKSTIVVRLEGLGAAITTIPLSDAIPYYPENN